MQCTRRVTRASTFSSVNSPKDTLSSLMRAAKALPLAVSPERITQRFNWYSRSAGIFDLRTTVEAPVSTIMRMFLPFTLVFATKCPSSVFLILTTVPCPPAPCEIGLHRARMQFLRNAVAYFVQVRPIGIKHQKHKPNRHPAAKRPLATSAALPAVSPAAPAIRKIKSERGPASRGKSSRGQARYRVAFASQRVKHNAHDKQSYGEKNHGRSIFQQLALYRRKSRKTIVRLVAKHTNRSANRFIVNRKTNPSCRLLFKTVFAGAKCLCDIHPIYSMKSAAVCPSAGLWSGASNSSVRAGNIWAYPRSRQSARPPSP